MLKWARDRGWPLIRRTVREWREDDGPVLASSMAYYAAFSFLPLMLFLLAMLGFALRVSFQAQQEQERILYLIEQHGSEALANQVAVVLAEVENLARLNGPIGLAILMYGAANIFVRLDTALMRIWKEPEARRPGRSFLLAAMDIVLHRLKAFVMLVLVFLLLLAAFTGSMLASAIQPYAVESPATQILWRVIQFSAGIGFHTLVFALVYKWLAKREVWWRDVLVGALLAGLCWEAVRQVLALFVVTGRFSAYGVIGSFIAIMLWFYVSAALLLIGAEFVQVLTSMRGERDRSSLD